ncbi:pentapeptide repeat-containing protein [Candidatus Synechococcus calcipolaris G9]|uniref:Pentapeptide repeat-containing protein n=1 Tax=Candidatus Synechococcus calcipolaris G9 TaxID=1497997 RepID=A0ABT6EY99_9SYNE|nr:pentapeptide repeat-containing protein [Candidatus Synechococcus calcipolaris]MDG2990781.1 pentapeptide repeat-containing protein [Candidatus Synechococcus calcipolaris G9]
MHSHNLLRNYVIILLMAAIPLPVLAERDTLPIMINGCVIKPNTDCRGLGNSLKYANLSGVDLSGANLSGLNLHGASLRNANLRGANLQRVELDMASLAKADLTGADLTDAYFALSDVAGANFQAAILTNVDLRGANGARTAILDGARLCNTTLPDGTIRNDHCP